MATTVEPVGSDSPMVSTHRVLGSFPRGRLVECGGICKKQNRHTGVDYFTLTIRDHGFNAILGKAANQDDPALQPSSPGAQETPPKVTRWLAEPTSAPSAAMRIGPPDSPREACPVSFRTRGAANCMHLSSRSLIEAPRKRLLFRLTVYGA